MSANPLANRAFYAANRSAGAVSAASMAHLRSSEASQSAYANWPARRTGLVEGLFPQAATNLVVIDQQLPVADAVGKFTAGVKMLVVICDGGGVVGVLTKTDVLSHLTLPQTRRSAHHVPASVLMSRDVVRCSPNDRLGAVWDMMHALDLRNIPITCSELKPLGIVNAGHALIAMLEEAEDEDVMLRDYIMGVGYR